MKNTLSTYNGSGLAVIGTQAINGEVINITSATAKALSDEAKLDSVNTTSARESDLKIFHQYCEAVNNQPSALALVEFLLNQSTFKKVSTVRRYYATLSQVYQLTAEQRKALNEKLRLRQKAQNLETIRHIKGEANEDGSEARDFSTSQAEAIKKARLIRIVEKIDKTTARGRRDACALCLAFFGGLRGSEVIGIRIEHISQTDNKNIKIVLYGTKTEPTATIYIYNEFAKKIILAYVKESAEQRPEGFLITKIDRWGHVTAEGISRMSWHRIVKEYGEDLQTHSFRRGAITELMGENVSITEAMQFSRHKDKQCFFRYVQTSKEEQTNGGRFL